MMRLFGLLIIISISACLNAQERIYVEDIIIPKDSLYLIELDGLPISYSIEARAALNKNNEQIGASRQEWGIVWNYKSRKDFFYAKILCVNSHYGDFLDQRYADVIIGRCQNGIDSIIGKKRFSKGIDTALGYNTLLLEWSNGVAKILSGSNELNFVTKLDIEANNGQCGVYTNEKLHVMSLVVELKQNIINEISTNWTKDSIENYLKTSDDNIEGYWEYLDRDNNDKKAKIGGRYKFAIVREQDEYLILYVSGGITNKFSWAIGMIKGRLKPTIFENHYDLVWYDSMFAPIEYDAYADITDGVILKLQFPIYESSFRLYKMRKASK